MLDQHYLDPRLARLYDLDSPWSSDRQYYLELARGAGLRILDVGCGTGLLTAALATAGHHVTGLDPSRAMLAIARSRPGGRGVEWVRGTAESLPVVGDFDLIIMTGNAFQALLEDTQVSRFFTRCSETLDERGRVVFETRNPWLDWTSRWDSDLILETEKGRVTESRRFLGFVGREMTFELCYRFPTDTITTTSRIRFWEPDEIRDLATGSGLVVSEVGGDFSGEAFDEAGSKELVFTLEAGGR